MTSAHSEGGVFEVLEDFADVEKEMDWIGKLSKAFGIPVSFALAARSPEDQMKLLRWMENINRGMCTPVHRPARQAP